MSSNNNHNFWPFLIKNPTDLDQHLVVIVHLSLEGFMVWKFKFPTIKMVVEKCKERSTRSPNSFIIFRSFFTRFVHIPSHYVGEISIIAQLIWNVATEHLKNAFRLLEKDVAKYLRTDRDLSFIMHDESNKSRGAAYICNSAINSGQNYPLLNTLNIDITTPETFNNKTNSIEPLANSFLESNEGLLYPNEYLLFEINEGSFNRTNNSESLENGFLGSNEDMYLDGMFPQILGSDEDIPQVLESDYLNYYDYGDYGDFVMLDSPLMNSEYSALSSQISTPPPNEEFPIQPVITADDTAEFAEFCENAQIEQIDLINLY